MWKVVGGGEKGGVVARQGESLKSRPCAKRLATGAFVWELARKGDRLRFWLASGDGPQEGWVSTCASGKDLLVPASKEEDLVKDALASGAAPGTAGHGPPVLIGCFANWPSPYLDEEASTPRPLSRRIRVLALHGSGSNRNIMRHSLSKLEKLLGSRAEWDFLDGTTDWTMEIGYKYGDPRFLNNDLRFGPMTEPINPGLELLEALSDGEPFRGWFTTKMSDESERHWIDKVNDAEMTCAYDAQLEDSAEKLCERLREKQYDVLLSFSNASLVLHVASAMWCADSQEPWRLSVMFSPFPVRDPRRYPLFEGEPLAQPCVMCFGTDDWSYRQGRLSATATYKDVMVLEHPEMHAIPGKTPEGEKVLAQVAREMLWRCGWKRENEGRFDALS